MPIIVRSAEFVEGWKESIPALHTATIATMSVSHPVLYESEACSQVGCTVKEKSCLRNIRDMRG